MPPETDAEALSHAERAERVSARDLVDLALEGHFCIRESIDEAIRYVYRTRGAVGRQLMNELADLHAYASEEEIDRWQCALLKIVEQIKHEESETANVEDPTQLKMFE